MLEFISIKRFKTLLDASFPLSSLNLFSGLNGMGKSSLIQTLLLLRQSHERRVLQDRGLLLKGEYINLGIGQDIFSAQAEIEQIEFLLTWQSHAPVRFSFNYAQSSDLQPLEKGSFMTYPEDASLFNGNFQYLSADRIGPRNQYELSDFALRELNSLGNHGEYAVQFIAEYGAKPIAIAAMRHVRAVANTFLENLNGWMSEISPGVRVRAAIQPQFNAATLAYAYEQGKEFTADFKPQNVGFGLTYALPVVTSLLRAKPGDLVLIENPESHMHPAGQSALGRMCALVAAHGVQLILETHSDHFLNGIRVAVKKGLIPAEQVRLFYLERHQKDASHASLVYNPKIDGQGRIDYWPKGFFDEWDDCLEQLL